MRYDAHRGITKKVSMLMSESFTIRRGTPDDVPVITEHRRLMFEAMGFTDPVQLDTMCAAFIPWVTERLANESYLAWLVLNERIFAVSGLGLWLREFPPNPGDMGGKRGHILNVYTYPDYRRRGFAKELVWRALEWCRDNGINGVTLHYTDAGRPIYESLGFAIGNSMFMWAKDVPARTKTEA
jgi:GNAT superfamily N-acetyltransferase